VVEEVLIVNDSGEEDLREGVVQEGILEEWFEDEDLDADDDDDVVEDDLFQRESTPHPDSFDEQENPMRDAPAVDAIANGDQSALSDLGSLPSDIGSIDSEIELSVPTDDEQSTGSSISEPSTVADAAPHPPANYRKRDIDTALEDDDDEDVEEAVRVEIRPAKRRVAVDRNDEHVRFAVPVGHESSDQQKAKEGRRMHRDRKYSRIFSFMQGVLIGTVGTFALLVYSAPPPPV